ncbi:unnamed protein product [Caenorhabditis sp. 36 PRJEB53466]|nr:unnamed protein product [Caenorhabditis sp. 36 PRJEB53466]
MAPRVCSNVERSQNQLNLCLSCHVKDNLEEHTKGLSQSLMFDRNCSKWSSYNFIPWSLGILANFSPVFKAMFAKNSFREATAAEMVIEDVDAKVFEVVLYYIHRYDIEISDGDVESVLQVAIRYGANVMKRKYLKKKLGTANFITFWKLM